MTDVDKNLIGRYRINHPLFEEIVFSDGDTAVSAAERLCVFLIKNSDRLSASIEITRYDTETSDGETQTIWWYYKTVEAELNINDNDE